MKKLLIIILLVVFLFSCTQQPSITLLNENDRPQITFQGSVEEVLDRIEEEGFLIQIFSMYLINEHNIYSMNREKLCYKWSEPWELIECNIESLERSTILVGLLHIEKEVIIRSQFVFLEHINDFRQGTLGIALQEILENNDTRAYRHDSFFDFYTGELIGTQVFLAISNLYSDDWMGCTVGGLDYFSHIDACNEEKLEIIDSFLIETEYILLNLLGFIDFEEFNEFLRAYFYWFVLPFFEELLIQLN